MIETIDNNQKYKNYKEQFARLNKSLKYEFYLEAIFIAYAILEDRCESVLRYEGNEVKAKDGGFVSIEKKLNKISTIARKKKSLPNKYFSDEFIDGIYQWKDKRNELIHALLKKSVSTDELKQCAEEGKELARQMANKATSYRRSVERRTKNGMQ